MKRLVAVLLMIVLTIPCVASADVLADGWENSELEELLDAQIQIAQHIARLSDTDGGTIDDFLLTGEGTEIRDVNLTLPPLSRFIFVSSDPDAEYTITVNGEDKKWILKADYFETEAQISRIMVQSKDAWAMSFEPIGFSDTPFISGNGNFVSDRFVIGSPAIVTVTFDYTSGGGNYWNEHCSFVIFSVDSEGAVKRKYLLSGEEVYSEKAASFDVIIDLDDDVQYCFWGVICNSKIKWSITAK